MPVQLVFNRPMSSYKRIKIVGIQPVFTANIVADFGGYFAFYFSRCFYFPEFDKRCRGHFLRRCEFNIRVFLNELLQIFDCQMLKFALGVA